MDGSLTGAGESDVQKQQLTTRVPLNDCPRGSTPNFSAAMEDCNLDAVKRPSCACIPYTEDRPRRWPANRE
jgi:hypothetical protein